MKLPLLLATVAFAAIASAQSLETPQRLAFFQPVQKRTIDLQRTQDGKFSLTYLHDGHQGYGGIAFTPSNVNGKLSYGALAVTDMGGKSLYVGALASYEVYRKGDWSAAFNVGLKGFDIGTLSFGPDPEHQVVFGFGIKGKV